MPLYFDNAATTALDENVIATMLPFMSEHFGNPSSIHSMGRITRAALEKVRRTIAQSLNASSGEIFFTSGGTESNNMALRCAVRDLGVSHIISSPIEHHCVLHCLEYLDCKRNVKISLVKLTDNGHIDLDHLEELVAKSSENQEGKTLVSLMHSNNEIGNILDDERVSEICDEHGAYFHSDSVQTYAYYPIDVQKIKYHFLSGAAHKFHGPKGVGFIYINGESMISPYVLGGAQERNMRAGTENLYGIIGMGKAVEIAMENMEEDAKYIAGLKSYFLVELKEAFPGIKFNGDCEGKSHYKVVNVSFPPSTNGSLLLIHLDIAGICASGGSACSSGSDSGSHVIKALKVDPERTNVRFSFSRFNKKEEIDQVLIKLKEIVKV